MAFSSFLAHLLASNDLKVIAVALKMCTTLMEKLPSIFSHYFRREGVVFEIERLASENVPESEDVKTFNLIKESAELMKNAYFKGEVRTRE